MSSNPFDQMKNASMQGGFNTIVKTSPPAATVFLTSGMGPYVGFFYAVEVSVSSFEINFSPETKTKLIYTEDNH